jgi:hypothetical protein
MQYIAILQYLSLCTQPLADRFGRSPSACTVHGARQTAFERVFGVMMLAPRGVGGMYHAYGSDEEAVAAEQRFVAAMGPAEKYVDPVFGGNSALYCDWTRPPLGFLPADTVQWGRISDLGVKDMLQPVLLSAPDDACDGGAAHPAAAPGQRSRRRRLQLVQGALPNTWLVNAMAAVASKRELLQGVFVSGKNWLRGIHTLRFFKSGQWVYVHVDDRVPLGRDRAPLCVRVASFHCVVQHISTVASECVPLSVAVRIFLRPLRRSLPSQPPRRCCCLLLLLRWSCPPARPDTAAPKTPTNIGRWFWRRRTQSCIGATRILLTARSSACSRSSHAASSHSPPP